MLTPEEVIKGLKPCHYKYNEVKDLGDKINFGFIAQDLLETFGDEYNFVQKDQGEEFLKVNYYQFIAPMVAMIKQQEERIKKLENQIEGIMRSEL